MEQVAYVARVGKRFNAYTLDEQGIPAGHGWKAKTNLVRWLQDHGYQVLARAPKR